MTLRHRNMTLDFDDSMRQTYFRTGDAAAPTRPANPFPPFMLTAAGIDASFGQATTMIDAPIPAQSECVGFDSDGSGAALTYRHANGLETTVTMAFVPGANVIRQTTSVRNTGDAPVTLTHVSGAFVQGIGADGLLAWQDPEKLRVHYCLQTWNGEGQWRSADPETLGLYHTSTHPSHASVDFASVGTWSTGERAPVLFVEDMELKKIWYFAIETPGSWHMELGYRGNWTDGDGTVCVGCDAADEFYTGWTRCLAPGEVYTSPAVAYGCCEGGFEQAVAELTRYRRTRKPANPWPTDCAVLFNDYMNCLWGNPTRETLLPLIDAAADAGCEGFCIDAGWYATRDRGWGAPGDWEPSPDRFGADGLAGILAHIRAKGMRPGVWLELEVCATDAETAKRPESWFLHRNGERVGQGSRFFLNFTSPDVRAHLHGAIDRLVALGCEYFKNDYNASVGVGADDIGTSAADGLQRNCAAFDAFIDEVKTRHPGLMIENCGSGGMRADAETLSHFDLQSSSDQEDYRRYPAVLSGSLANVLPEQLGIWAYPYPHLFGVMRDAAVLDDPAYLAAMADGEQTVFNMVSAMCGRLYLSGRIDKADDFNRARIAEGVAVYKRERGLIANSVPFWPLGLPRYNDTRSWTALGLRDDRTGRVLLAVWRLGSDRDTCTIPVRGAVRQLYPAAPAADLTAADGLFTVRLPKPYSARLFAVEAE